MKLVSFVPSQGVTPRASSFHSEERRIDMLILSFGSPSKGGYSLGKVKKGEKQKKKKIRNGEKHDFTRYCAPFLYNEFQSQ